MQKKGNKYGTHRVIEPKGLLTQAAKKIDNNMDEIWSNEILCDVTALNIDSASFTQIYEACEKDLGKTEQMILDIVAERGKMQNPVTGSGGMFIGTVKAIGEDLEGKIDLKVGDKIASLVSLSLTPLKINKIKAIHPEIDRVEVDAQAILFESGLYAKLPDDMSEELALAALDVAGAPAQTAKLVKPGDSVLILGGAGKGGMMCCYEAMKRVGPTGNVVALVICQEDADLLKSMNLCHHAIGHLHPDRQRARLRDERHPARPRQRHRVLLLHGHRLRQGRSGRRGLRQGRHHGHRQRLHQGPRRHHPGRAARESPAEGVLREEVSVSASPTASSARPARKRAAPPGASKRFAQQNLAAGAIHLPRGCKNPGPPRNGTLRGALRENPQLKEYFEKKYL